MMVKITALLLKVQRLLSRNEWAVRLLGMPRVDDEDHERGLVLIQIDGLSRQQLEAAIARGRMPFLSRLLGREHYRLTTMYSGIPSSTPAVQGELFYGERCATPAFSFYSQELGRQVAMAEPDAAESVESRISANAAGLLEGGSAYCDVYSGGATEAHFCAQNMGLGGFLKSVSLLRLLIVSTWYCWSLICAVGLTVLEMGLAIGGFVSGALDRREFFAELKFVPARVVVVVLLREFVTIGATLDVARGVRIVHLNLLGYDEQAHRRGPESEFAHWTLRGIDRAIQKIWRAAHRSDARHYDVWVYSDHGQETTTPYSLRHDESIQQTVAHLLGKRIADEPTGSRRHEVTECFRWIGRGPLWRWMSGPSRYSSINGEKGALVVANGPVGLIYLEHELGEEGRRRLASRLVEAGSCPLVLVADGPARALAFDVQGVHQLPAEAAQVLGETHPFLDAVAEDLVRLAHHPDSGSLVICGWDKSGDSLSFPQQHGAHAGPGVEETSAFILAPAESPIQTAHASYARPSDLRQAALQYFSSKTHQPRNREIRTDETRSALRVMTYNVHACVGMDNRRSPARIARVIARSEADIVALQELDVTRRRSGGVDQAHQIARELEMTHHFHAAWSLEEEQFGDAILSRHPMRLVKAGPLPGPKWSPGEPRGALWVEVTLDGQTIQVINTHLGVTPRQRRPQFEALLSEDWLADAMLAGPVVLSGDFNFGPTSRLYRRLRDQLTDAVDSPGSGPAMPTWVSWKPVTRIDHIFVSADFNVVDSQIMSHRLSRDASDHLPVVADLAAYRTPAAKDASPCQHSVSKVATRVE